MAERSDMDLLREFAENGSESAFAELVERHLNMVYSAALRRVGDVHSAEDVAQVVFLILARKAGRLGSHTALAGWLYEATRFTSSKLLRTRIRQQNREREAAMQNLNAESSPDPAWGRLAPFLEQGMEKLSSTERAILVMRFFENKSSSETASALGIGEWAARKRTSRAVDKLRRFFSKRGVTLTSTIIIAAISGNSVQAAPIGLAETVTTSVVKSSAVGSSTLTLVKGAIKLMAWSKMKTTTVAVAVVILAGTATLVMKAVKVKQRQAERAAYMQRFASIPGSIIL
jgi:RNA polymerase sigma factor (sigma-70 family)